MDNRLTFLNEVISLYPETLLFAELKAVLLMEMNRPIEALAQTRATHNIKPNSPMCERLFEIVLKRLEREGLLQQVTLNNFEKAFLSDLSCSFCQMPFTNFEVFNTGKTFIEEGPRNLNMAYDYTCNLHCPSCRRKLRAAGFAMQTRLEEVRQKVMDQVLSHVHELQIAGDGDPFASKHYRSILALLDKGKHPNLRFKILTNGVLFTPKVWEEFTNIQDMLETVQVSVDAAKPETYRQIRRGGDFGKLIKNLRFLANKRAEKAFNCLQQE